MSLFISGCATYQSRISASRTALGLGQCDSALVELEKISAEETRDQLAYLLDYGSALQICGDYNKSNTILLKAEKLSEGLDFHSVSKIAAATLFGEEMVQYKGDTFEKFFINVMLAVNYLQLGQPDEALVEARKIDQKYLKLSAEDKKNYELSSISKLLSSLIWTAEKKYDDACIDAVEAYKIDPSYREVGLHLLRVCAKAKRDSIYQKYLKELQPNPTELAQIKSKKTADLYIIYLQGWGPRKRPRWNDSLFPELEHTASVTQKLTVSLRGSTLSTLITATTTPTYNVESVAKKTLNADYSSLVARRLVARVAKEIAAREAIRKDALAGSLLYVTMLASDRADLRQWSILPETLQTAYFSLEPGEYTVSAQGLDVHSNASESWPEKTIHLISGKTQFLIFRSVK